MKAPLLGLVVASVAFGASALHFWNQLEKERARAAQVEKATLALKARVAELERARDQLESARMAPAGEFIAGRLDPAHPTAVAPQPASEPSGEGGQQTAVWSAVPQKPSPAMLKMMRSQLRANNRRIYADLGQKLGLSQEMSHMLIDLLTDQQMPDPDRFRRSDDPGDLRRQGLDWQRQNEQAISDLIGPAKAQALKEYQATLPARMEADNLAQQLEGSDLPLSADQRKRLIDAYVIERARVPPPEYVEGMDGEAFSRNMLAWHDDYEARVTAEVGRILNPEQLSTFNEIQQWQKEMRSQFASATGGRMLRRTGVGNAVTLAAPAGTVSMVVEGQVPDPAAEKKRP
ncbi:MAG TPA: hypothetical protein VFP37_04340 [Steroidobacteraceae bacterium]|nr:hypothetical protein [Steroidobacteraceae bacterium]